MRTTASRSRGGVALALLLMAAVAVALGPPAGAQSETVGPPAPPANDAFAAAQDVGELACEGVLCQATLEGSTVAATMEELEPEPCPLGATVWYRLDLAEESAVALGLASDFASVLAVHVGDDVGLADLATEACVEAEPFDGPFIAGLEGVAGPGALWIQVGGVPTEGGAEAGSFTLEVTVEALDAELLSIVPGSPVVRANEKLELSALALDDSIQDVAWDFGDGTTATGFDVVHRWTEPGQYEVVVAEAAGEGVEEVPSEPVHSSTVVTVTRASLTPLFTVQPSIDLGEGCCFEVCLQCDGLQLEVGDWVPTDLPDPIVVPVGTTLMFTEEAFGGSGELSFSWSFGDEDGEGGDGEGGEARGEGTTGSPVWHTFSAIGSYPVTLTVSDDDDTRSRTRVVHVYDEGPLTGHVDPGTNLTMEFPGYVSVVCEVGIDGAAIDFDGVVVVATHPAALGDGSGPFPGDGALFISIQGGPEEGQCDRVVITVLYDDGLLADAGASERRLRVFYWNDDAWRALRSGSIDGATPDRDLHVFSVEIDPEADRAVFVTNHTSTFALGTPAGGGGGGSAPSAPAAPAPAPAAPAAPAPAAPAAPAAPGPGTAAGAGAAGSGSAGGSGAGAPAALTVRRPDGSPLPGVELPGATLDGEVEVVARNAPAGSVLVLVGKGGQQSELARDAAQVHWDTAAAENGRYRLELHGEDGVVLASTSYLVYNGRGEVSDVAGGVLLGAAVMGGGFLLSVLLNVLREGATAVSEDKFRERTKKHRVTAWLARIPTLPSLLVGVPIFIAFFTLDGMPVLDLQAYLDRLPYVAAAGILVFASAYSLEILLNVASGARSRFQLLLTGALALAFSTLLFRTAFGYPGFVEEEEVEGGLPARVEGLRSVALLSVILFLAAPFFLILAFASYPLGETGMAIVLSLLATSSLPFRPVPGANLWRWSKTASIAAILVTFGGFMAFELGLVPLAAVAVAGLVGLAVFLAIYRWLRVRGRTATPEGPAELPGAAAPAEASTPV